LKAATFTD